MRTSILGLAILAVLVAACAPAQQSTTGRAVFALTDAAADMGAVSSVKVTVDSVRVHNDAQGWVTVTSTPQTYDLLALKASGDTVLLADLQLSEGSYQQIRLDISSVVVVDENGTHDAKLPSGELKIVGGLDVEANTTSAVTFDFIADESLHVTGNGQYIMAPVVKLETRTDADVEVSSDKRVEVSGGRVKTDIKVGMDVAGNVGVGLSIAKDAPLSVEGGKVKLGIGVGEERKANASMKSEVDVTA
ncbi:DUF4382 domain-containing protein [Candidatus Woesearchaeota archaeon]|nr:DUF4382 domain-containing protein [Candidatus Woesearchaeota archaeon]